jgi:hypothetical protein
MTALKAAIPPAPDGWKLASTAKIEADDRVCEGAEKSPKRIYFHAEYVLEVGREEREKTLQQAVVQGMPAQDQQAQMKALQQEIAQEASRRGKLIQEAITRNDMAEVQRLSKENEKWNAENDAKIQVLKSGIDSRMASATEKQLLKDMKAQIVFAVNESSESLWKARALTMPGFAQAYRNDGYRKGETDWVEGTTRAYLGDWSKDQTRSRGDSTVLRSDPNPDPKVQTLAISIVADEKRADQLLKGLKLDSIKALMR